MHRKGGSSSTPYLSASLAAWNLLDRDDRIWVNMHQHIPHSGHRVLQLAFHLRSDGVSFPDRESIYTEFHIDKVISTVLSDPHFVNVLDPGTLLACISTSAASAP